MKISYNWLKQYIDINIAPNELGEILTNTGLEVEHIENFCSIKGALQGLVVGEVLSKEKHPNADKLSVAKVDVGSENNLNIVCGAKNLEAGQKVIVATIGTTIHPMDGEGFTIKKAKLRGEPSEGMICAEDEIGLGYSHDGIMVLDSTTAVGTLASDLFEVEEDFIFEIGLTPNRTDAMSHIGVAKDIAAALNAANKSDLRVKQPDIKYKDKKVDSKFSISIEDDAACPRYSGVVLNNISIAESPKWLQNRLLAIGIRPINNIVDITNFVLKEYGQALHAFDYSAIQGEKIVVKTLATGTKFTTLDEVERELSEEDLMICNAKEAMCIAGVFGGAKSGVQDSTKSIFLESAYFDSTFIRKTSTKHGLRTDAAQRYEKGADPTITILALERAIQLMQELAGAEIASPIYDIYPKEIVATEIKFRFKRLNTLAGVEFKKKLVTRILKDLDFSIIHENENELLLKAPLYRADVLREVDVVEEVMRIYGFNNIVIPNQVKSTLSFQNGKNEHQLKEKIAFQLNGFGFSEIMTNSISQSNFYEEDTPLVHLQNSMTSELDIMRASLIPEALNVIKHNLNRKNTDLKFYEFGNIYNEDHSQNEKLMLYYTGQVLKSNWISPKQKSTLFHLKGIANALIEELGITDCNVSIINDNEIYLDKRDKEIAKIWSLKETTLEKFEVEQAVFCAEFNWDVLVKLSKRNKIRFKELSKFPEVSRDLAVILDENINFDAILQKIKSNTGSILKNIDLFDVFKNADKIGVNKKSYALNFKLQDANKTLTDKEIDKTISKIITTLENNFDATIRK